MSFPQGKSPPWLPPSEARAPLLVVRRHWLALALDLVVPTVVLAAVLAAVGLVGLASAQLVLVVLVAAALWAAVLSARWYATSFTLTPRTMVLLRGLAVRSCKVIALEMLQDVRTEQSLLGSLLGYGTVELSMLSGAHERLTRVPNPDVVRDRVFSRRLGGTS